MKFSSNRLAWATDTHLNCVSPSNFSSFARTVRSLGVSRLLITGDVSKGPSVVRHLTYLAQYLGSIPISFVMGNHDYWSRGFQPWEPWPENLHYLTDSDPLDLGGGSYLVGVDGWYDGRAGEYEGSRFRMADVGEIPEWKLLSRSQHLAAYRQRADAHTRLLLQRIQVALTLGATRIIIATHFPPFARACLFRGDPTAPSYLPFYCNRKMGVDLTEIAESQPNVSFLVLCGHTHGACTYQPLPNLICMVGSAEYRHPEVCGVLDLSHLFGSRDPSTI